MSGYWNGGNNPDIDYGKMAYIPEIAFEVESNDEYEESTNRSAGLLKALGVSLNRTGNPMTNSNAMFATSYSDVAQNTNRPTSLSSFLSMNVQVGADLLQKDEQAKLLIRYWLGDDKDNALAQEMKFTEA